MKDINDRDQLNLPSQSTDKVTEKKKQPAPPGLKLLFTVIPRSKAELYTALLQSYDANLQLLVSANGTADSEALAYLGIESKEKTVIVSIIRENMADGILHFLEEKFKSLKNGKGIAFTVPFSSIIGVASYQFLAKLTNT